MRGIGMGSQRLIRVYKNLDIDEIKNHVLLYGALAGQCGKCSQLNVKLDAVKCPACSTEFNFIAFSNIKDHLPKIAQIQFERPYVTFVDHDDFKRISGAIKAEGFLK